MALVELQQQPPWFQQHQAADHMSAEQAQKFAGTDGEWASGWQQAADLQDSAAAAAQEVQ